MENKCYFPVSFVIIKNMILSVPRVELYFIKHVFSTFIIVIHNSSLRVKDCRFFSPERQGIFDLCWIGAIFSKQLFSELQETSYII